jgi:hypothetical protein
MRAQYDSDANAISIELVDVEKADQADQAHARAVVAIRGGRPIELQLLYPDMGVSEPLAAVASRHGLDREALAAAAAAALAAPDRSVSVDVALRPAASLGDPRQPPFGTHVYAQGTALGTLFFFWELPLDNP